MKIHFNGFLKSAIEHYPKEVCGFLFSSKPYTLEEEWFVYPIKNIKKNPEEGWIPDKKEMLSVKSKAVKLGLVKIGNIHNHPYHKEWGEYNIDKAKEIVQPSDIDLKFARKFNDIIRIIICNDDKCGYDMLVHDKFGNKLDIFLEGVD